MPQPCNLDGISMKIQEEDSAHYFQVQSEREQTLVISQPRGSVVVKRTLPLPSARTSNIIEDNSIIDI